MITMQCKNCNAYVSGNFETNEQLAEAHKENCSASPGYRAKQLRAELRKELTKKG